MTNELRTAGQIAEHLTEVGRVGPKPAFGSLDELWDYIATLPEYDATPSEDMYPDGFATRDGDVIRYSEGPVVGGTYRTSWTAMTREESAAVDEQAEPCPAEGCVLRRTDHDAHADYDTYLWMTTSAADVTVIERDGQPWHALVPREA